MIGYEQQRLTMVETQLRPNTVTDRRLLAAISELPRELFVPASKRGLAYSDAEIEVWPAVDGAAPRFLLAPMVLARLVQLASVEPGDHVLDIGAATGYSTAVLSRLAGSVVALEPEPELAASARETLQALGIANARVVSGPLNKGHALSGPYDVILLNGRVPEVPDALLAQLKEGGRLAAIVATSAQAKATLFFKVEGEASGLPHFDASAKPLPGFMPAPSFAF